MTKYFTTFIFALAHFIIPNSNATETDVTTLRTYKPVISNIHSNPELYWIQHSYDMQQPSGGFMM